ncbi:MAG TPA: hypothetical protein DCM14_00035 [Clostridiales bacterium UBA8153]|nr:hypothetical protein [Clostridiales bacterium UBA8153]
MADATLWVCAGEGTLPWPAGSFLAAYGDNRAGAVEAIFEADAIAQAVRELVEARGSWTGTAGEPAFPPLITMA